MKPDVVSELTKLETLLRRMQRYAFKAASTDIPGVSAYKALLDSVEYTFAMEISEVMSIRKEAEAGRMGSVRLMIDNSLGKMPSLDGMKYADHVMPRSTVPFFRQNYDYDEGWNTILDEFRQGKIKNVVEHTKNTRYKPKKKKADLTAVIIKGNPEYIEGNSDAERFYNEVGNYLEANGVKVSYDPGEPHTSPTSANLWIGHSRGVDRLQFAPKGTETVGLSAPNYEGAITHPEDDPQVGKEPSQYHYIFTDEMKSEIDDALSNVKRGDQVIATSEEMMDMMDSGSESLLPLVMYHPRSKKYWKQLKNMKGGKGKAVQDFIDYVSKD